MTLVHLAIGLTVASLALYGTMFGIFLVRMARRRKQPPRAAHVTRAPRVTIFKPLAGYDDDLEANLESFAHIDYPSFEIVFGVASPADPAYAVARRFVASHPRIAARLVVTDPTAAINPKVAQLVGMERVATGEVYVISDSNVRVEPGYLWSMVADLSEEGVGMVVSIFAGSGERTLGAALENLQLCASSAPGMVAFDAVSDRPLTVGKSMAVRRRDLARLGGFLPVGHVLAEDHALGRRFLDAGFVARTSLEPVQNRNVACTMGRTLERHTRWCKMRRTLHPVAFAVEPILTPILAASAGFAMAPGKVTATMLVGATVLQTGSALLAVRVLRRRWMSWRYVPLEVLRSYVSLLCWARACGSRRIEWRGHAFTLKRDTAIVPVAAARDDRAAERRLAA